MRKNMRAVAVALIVLTISASSVLAQSRAKNPFVDDDPFGSPPPSKSRVVKKAKIKLSDPFGVVKVNKKKPPLTIEARSQGVSVVPFTPACERIRRALDEKTSLQFQDAELGEIIAYLKKKHNIEIQFDKVSLEELDLGSDAIITCVVKDVSLRSALKLMLRDHEMAYIIRDEVLLITTVEVAEENMETKIYDVADLVTYRDEKGKHWTDYDPLIDMLTSTIEPEAWMIVGGNGSITGNDFGAARVLVVTQTEEVHRQIAGVLTAIRKMAARSPDDGRPPLRPRPKDVPMQPMSGPAKLQPGGMSGGMGGMSGGMF